MPTGDELKALANNKMLEVETLYNSRLHDGASYASGYVLEFALKAAICTLLCLDEYPPPGELAKTFKTHSLDNLVTLAGLKKELQALSASNPNFYNNWSVVTSWSEQLRYKPIGTSTKKHVEDIINALKDPKDGVFTWIKTKW